MASLELRSVSVHHPGAPTELADVSLTVPPRGTLVVLSTSRADSTLLVRTIAGLEDHTDGDVLVDGTLINVADPRLRNAAFVPAEPSLHPRLDVYENLGFAARLQRGVSEHELAAEIAAVADALALSDLIDVRPADLTLAQRQRVALGRELIRDASIWLFDDCFSAQSERIRPHLRTVVQQWQADRGRTSVFTTTSVVEALAYGDQLAVLHTGVLHQIGESREVYAHPSDLLVASVVGAPPMNLMPVAIDGHTARTPLGDIELSDDSAAALDGLTHAVLGFRAERATLVRPSGRPRGPVLTGEVGDVEWRGADQWVYVAFDPTDEATDIASHLEDVFDSELFQNFVIAVVPGVEPIAVGDPIRIALSDSDLLFFDADSGFDLEFEQLLNDEDLS